MSAFSPTRKTQALANSLRDEWMRTGILDLPNRGEAVNALAQIAVMYDDGTATNAKGDSGYAWLKNEQKGRPGYKYTTTKHVHAAESSIHQILNGGGCVTTVYQVLVKATEIRLMQIDIIRNGAAAESQEPPVDDVVVPVEWVDEHALTPYEILEMYCSLSWDLAAKIVEPNKALKAIVDEYRGGNEQVLRLHIEV